MKEMAGDKLSLITVFDRKFGKNEEVSLDNMRFVNCSFEDCHMLYSGGPFLMDNCRIQNCRLTIQGAAAILLQSLEMVGFQIRWPTGWAGANGSERVQ